VEIAWIHVTPRRSCHYKSHSLLAHQRLLSKEDKPTREHCRTQLSIEHITVECPEFNGLRSIQGNPTSTEQALGEKRNTHNVFKYFQLTGVEKLL